MLRAEVTQAREAAAAAEATCVAMVLAAETSSQEAAATRDSTMARVKDAEDQAALQRGRLGRGSQEWRWRAPRYWTLVTRRQKALSKRLTSLRVSLQRHVGLTRWSRRLPVACPTQQLMSNGGGRSLRESTESSLRSSPSCGPGALSCAMPLSVLHG
jgi:hypothetical protein